MEQLPERKREDAAVAASGDSASTRAPSSSTAPHISSSSSSGGGGGTVFLDTVTVELTTGTDLVAKPYGHSVSGRHMMLSQAGTLWKATRSAREKRFYATIVAAATGHWAWLDAEEAEARRLAAAAHKSGADGEEERQPSTPGSDVGANASPLHPAALHTTLTAAANALTPFLPRYYGTRHVAALKVGSIGFCAECEAEQLSPGEYNDTTSHWGSEKKTNDVSSGCSNVNHNTNRDKGRGEDGLTQALGSRGTSQPQSSSFAQMPQNASRVVIHTDAVKQVMTQFAKDKQETLTDVHERQAQQRGRAGGREVAHSSTSEKLTRQEEGEAGAVCDTAHAPASSSTPAASPATPSPSRGSLVAHVSPEGAVLLPVDEDRTTRLGEPAADGGVGGRSPLPCDGDVVAVATAQIAEELSRRLPPRQPDLKSGSPASATNASFAACQPDSSPPQRPHDDGGNNGRGDAATHGGEKRNGAVSPTPTAGSGTGLPQRPSSTATTSSCGAEGGSAGAGTAAAAGDGWVEMIVLQDVCHGFQYPCVLDVKMGTRQYGLHAKPTKIAEKAHKAAISTSQTYGVRLAGFKRWSATHQSFEVKSKHDLFTLDFDAVTAMLHYFLSSYQPPALPPQDGVEGLCPRDEGEHGKKPHEEAELAARAALKAAVTAAAREKLCEQFTRLLAAFEAHGIFRFYTSSLLIAYDAADPVGTVRAVMVDFAYAYEWKELVAAGDPDARLSVDEGYIAGLRSLIEALRTPM